MNSAVMFRSHKLSPSKKTFQKPNILRRKSKMPSIRAPCKPSPTPPAVAPLTKHRLPKLAPKHVEEGANPQDIPQVRLELAQDVAGTHSAAVDSEAEPLDVSSVSQECVLLDDAEPEHELVDVEAFLTGGRSAQYKAQYEIHTKLENNSLQKWHIDFENAADTIIMESSCSASRAEPGPAGEAEAEEAGAGAAVAGGQAARGELAEFQCSEASCGKAFATEQKLRRHRAVHNKRRAARAQPVECPARGGGGGGGGGAACARVFAARELLAEHLRADHQPEDAPHRCGECGRRFFWAVGLRAHSRAHAAAGGGGAGGGRALHACAWPGCARVFRQPCRLREHARAHTGDRPYRCTHPGCGWAFRTASKLLRHARKHTGERRHRCACGRAFRRREHLRDHQARHAHAATAAAGSQECGAAPEPAARGGDVFTERLADSEAGGRGGPGGRGGRAGAGGRGGPGCRAGPAAPGDARAARTHCTWPLAHHAPDSIVEERSCAVRSDLFLAAAGGEDSQQLMASASVAGGADADAGADAEADEGAGAGAGAGAALEAASPLGLLDLMQEELLYTDAVDESSFQVLLLSEELG